MPWRRWSTSICDTHPRPWHRSWRIGIWFTTRRTLIVHASALERWLMSILALRSGPMATRLVIKPRLSRWRAAIERDPRRRRTVRCQLMGEAKTAAPRSTCRQCPETAPSRNRPYRRSWRISGQSHVRWYGQGGGLAGNISAAMLVRGQSSTKRRGLTVGFRPPEIRRRLRHPPLKPAGPATQLRLAY